MAAGSRGRGGVGRQRQSEAEARNRSQRSHTPDYEVRRVFALGCFCGTMGRGCDTSIPLVECSPSFGPPEMRQCYTVESLRLRTPSSTCASEGDMSHRRPVLPLCAFLNVCLLAAVHAQTPACDTFTSYPPPSEKGARGFESRLAHPPNEKPRHPLRGDGASWCQPERSATY